MTTKLRLKKTFVVAAVALTGLPVLLASAAAAAEQRAAVASASANDRVHVKFVEDSAIRLKGDSLVSLSGADVSELGAVVSTYPGLRIEPLFSRAAEELTREKARSEQRSGRELPDKTLWYRMILPPAGDVDALIADLRRLAIVETTYVEPQASPPPVTPSFVDDQGYLDAATDGIDAEYAWTIAGGTGANIRVIDIEYSWNQNHEDLDSAAGPAVLIANGTPSDPFNSPSHGAAVLGELIGTNDSIGVTGIVSDASVGLVNAFNIEDGYDLADAIDLATANAVAGDVILIEQQAPGANGGCGLSQVGCVAVEWVDAYYDAIVNATAAGIIVVEAAGNGSEDLGDIGDYGNPFPAGRADSGAIIVGAGAAPGCTNPARGRLGFSTFGPRVNLQGWGECVVTAGYGNLQGGPINEWYTNAFGGTSSASPIVAGAAGILSSVAQQQGVLWTPQLIRARLVDTGTEQVFGEAGNIGPLPNLREALEALVPTIVVTGNGRFTTDGGGRVDFTLSNQKVGFDRIRGQRFSVSGEVESVTGSGNEATLTGSGSWNGKSGYPFEVSVVDKGGWGRLQDTISVVIRDPAGTVVFTGFGPQVLKRGDITVTPADSG